MFGRATLSRTCVYLLGQFRTSTSSLSVQCHHSIRTKMLSTANRPDVCLTLRCCSQRREGMRPIARCARWPQFMESRRSRTRALCLRQPTMAYWLALLDGDSADLGMLAEALSSAQCHVLRRDNGFALRSDLFDGETSADDILRVAREVACRLSGASMTLLGTQRAFEVGRLVRVDDDGREHAFVFPEPGVLIIRGFPPSITLTRADGSVETRRPGDPLNGWMSLAFANDTVARALRIQGRTRSGAPDRARHRRRCDRARRERGGAASQGPARRVADERHRLRDESECRDHRLAESRRYRGGVQVRRPHRGEGRSIEGRLRARTRRVRDEGRDRREERVLRRTARLKYRIAPTALSARVPAAPNGSTPPQRVS